MRRALRTGLAVLALLLVAAAAWLVFTGARAVSAGRDAEEAIAELRSAVDDRDFPGVREAAEQAREAALRADDALDDPLWAAVSAVPYLGDSAETARVTAAAVAVGAEGATPLLDIADLLDPTSLYADGRVAVDALEQARQPLAETGAQLRAAADRASTAPTRADGAWVLATVDRQRIRAQSELAEAADGLATAAAAAEVVPLLFGSEGPRTWFVGLQSPNEARGTGGLMGNFVVLTAEDGRLSLERTGSNSDLPSLPSLPDFGEDFAARYGPDPRLSPNSNLSPHFPYAGRLWQEFYAQASGVSPDVVIGTDAVALGHLVEATGALTLPDGRVVDAQEVVDFALTGVYAAYPDPAEREEYQEQIASAVFTRLTTGTLDAQALVSAVGTMVAENRLQVWSPREEEQQTLLALPTSGSVAATPGPYAYPVVINGSGSKLDAYLTRTFTYEVGRCDIADRVLSRLRLTLESSIPPEADLPDYVIGQSVVGPTGPVSSVQLQIHLSPDAVVDYISVDGEPKEWFGFREEGRQAVLVVLDLPPRQPLTVVVDLSEPESDLPARMPDQPLAQPAEMSFVDTPCDLGT